MGTSAEVESVGIAPSQVIRTGWIVAAAALCAAVPLVVDRVTSSWAAAPGTFYPSFSWVLALGLFIAGLSLSVGGTRDARLWRGPACAVAVVMAAQLAGTGLVAFKHWKTHAGYGTSVGHVTEQRALAAVMALTCAAAVVVVAWRLVAWGDFPVSVRAVPRWVAAVAGVALAVWLPGAIGGSWPDNHDATSLVAYALIYSLPWGAAVALTAWVARPAALAALLAVAASAALAWVGEPMIDLVLAHQGQRPFLVAAAVALVVVLVRFGVRDRTTSH